MATERSEGGSASERSEREGLTSTPRRPPWDLGDGYELGYGTAEKADAACARFEREDDEPFVYVGPDSQWGRFWVLSREDYDQRTDRGYTR